MSSFELLASVLVLVRAAVSPKDRGFCLALGIGMCLWALGDFAMTYESIHNANPPTPVLANYLWAGFFPLAYVGVMMLMRQEVRKFTAANYLDGVVVTLTCAAAFAAFAFGFIQKAVGDDSVTVAWNLIYPVGDILLLILTLGAAALVPAGRRKRWYLMAAASLVNAIGDVCALFDNGIGATHFGYFWNSIAWPASLFLFSLSVWVDLAAGRTRRAQGNELRLRHPRRGRRPGTADPVRRVAEPHQPDRARASRPQRSWPPASASAWR